MAVPAIKVNNVSFSYSQFMTHPALDNVDLSIEQGAFVGIVGHTGSGKSTLVSLVDGLLKPSQGTVAVNGVVADSSAKPAQLAKLRQHVGYVFQFPEQQLFAETVEEDIAFGPTNLGWDTERISAAVEKALTMVGLPKELAKRSPFSLSGGQKRRVALAGVLAMEPSILILDEPTAGLDAVSTRQLMQNIVALNKQGTTILMITHQMDQVAAFADQVLVMNQGKLVKNAKPENVFVNPQFLQANHLAVPATTDLVRRLNRAGIDIGKPRTLAQLADRLAAKLKEGHYE